MGKGLILNSPFRHSPLLLNVIDQSCLEKDSDRILDVNNPSIHLKTKIRFKLSTEKFWFQNLFHDFHFWLFVTLRLSNWIAKIGDRWLSSLNICFYSFDIWSLCRTVCCCSRLFHHYAVLFLCCFLHLIADGLVSKWEMTFLSHTHLGKINCWICERALSDSLLNNFQLLHEEEPIHYRRRADTYLWE